MIKVSDGIETILIITFDISWNILHSFNVLNCINCINIWLMSRLNSAVDEC